MRASQFNWIPMLFIIGYHLLLFVGLPFYLLHASPSLALFLWSVALVYITGMSVTAGYHRLYSHTTYKIHPVPEAVLLFFATMAAQGSVFRWSFDHRHHHAFVDTDRDPYSIKKGFWYAHFLWLLEKPKPIENKVIADLVRNPLLRFQDRFYGPLMIVTNVMLTLFMGWCFNDYLGSFMFIFLVRMFLLHHFTWFINSLAHTWGARQFCNELSAVDNYIISLVTFGEGYHNYHHTFAGDYRNGIRWFHFDPTKWLIWTLNRCGLAHSLRKMPELVIQEKIILEQKELLLKGLSVSPITSKASWEEKIHSHSENLLLRLKEIGILKTKLADLRKQAEKEPLLELVRESKAVKKNFQRLVKDWMALSRDLKMGTQ